MRLQTLLNQLIALSLIWTNALFAVAEILDTFSTAQGLSLGQAYTADAEGHAALFYNPAGLAKQRTREVEINLGDLQSVGSLPLYQKLVQARTPSTISLLSTLQSNQFEYTYARLNFLSSVAVRGLAAAVWGAYEFAGESTASEYDVDTRYDVGLTVGAARNFAGNLVKIGVAGKAILRNQFVGTFAHSAIGTAEDVSALSQEGYGLGFDVGVLVTLPFHSLPTLGIVWKDALNTHFQPFTLFNSLATGAPRSINQSFNVGISIHPAFTPFTRTIIAIEMRHIERVDLPFSKKWHAGLQLAMNRTTFFWLGMNQFQIGGGVGLRLPGGHFEVGTYGKDIGEGSVVAVDRRYFFRYTVSF